MTKQAQHRAASRPAPIPPRPAAPSLPLVRADLFLALAALAVYLATRLWGLGRFPIHYDEASYLHWGQIIAHNWDQRLIMTGWGGKQPLFLWIVALFNLLTRDALWAGRVVPVLAGLGTMAALWLTGWRYFGRAVAWGAAALYIAVPYLAVFDRVAVLDGFLTCLAAWTLYLSWRLGERSLAAIPLGLLIGAALLTKSAAWLYFPFILLGPLACARPREAYRAAWPRLALAAVGGYLLYYLVFGAGPGAEAVRALESQVRYSFSPQELLALPLAEWWANAGQLASYYWGGLTPPLALAALAVLAWALIQRRKRALLALAWGLGPTAAVAVMARLLFSRYVVFAVPPLLLAIAAGVEWAAASLLRLSRSGDGHSAKPKPSPQGHDNVGLAGKGGRYVYAALLLALAAYPLSRTLTLAAAPAALVENRPAYLDEYLVGVTGLWPAREALLADAAGCAASQPCYVLTHWLFDNVGDAAPVVLARDEQFKVLNIVGAPGGRIGPQGPPYAVIDAYSKAARVYAPAELARAKLYFIYDTRRAAQLGYADLLTPLASFPNLAGDNPIGLYTIRLDERFVAGK